MTRLEDRQILAQDITQACDDGARLAPACAVVGIDARTLQRWRAGAGLAHGDRRVDAARLVPSHALSAAERARIIAVANEPRFADTPPARIVPRLADEGIYLASEASFHRVLRAHGQMNRRGRAQPPRKSGPPRTHIATRPGEVWCWDVTFLPAQVHGRWFYLYLILDLFSRKIVGFEVHDTDSAEHAAHLGQTHGICRKYPCDAGAAGAARRQRSDAEGDHGAGHAVLARHHAILFAPAGQR
jgi:transposase InsO family protein